MKIVREEKQNNYVVEKENERSNMLDTSKQKRNESNPGNKWPPKTILIVGDSMINKLDEQKRSTSMKRTVKVRSFPGSTVEQTYINVDPLLKKKPDITVLHVGTNDAVDKTSDSPTTSRYRYDYFVPNYMN